MGTSAKVRALVANLDCELRWAQAKSCGPHPELPPRVRKHISEVSRSFLALGRPGDTLIPLESLGEESPGDLSRFTAILPWGQTRETPGRPSLANNATCWQEKLWQLHCESAIAATCNDRRFCQDLDVPPSLSLENVVVVGSLADLDHYIATQPLGPRDSWVAKAPWSASGRERLKRRGRSLEGEPRVRAERLLRRYEKLLVEPWMDRTADFGVAGLVAPSIADSMIFAAHELRCDEGGVFRGIRIADEEIRERLGFHAAQLQSCANLVLTKLHRAGYRGPFGIDAFLYRERDQERLCAVCEINARMNFGLVARAQFERAASPPKEDDREVC